MCLFLKFEHPLGQFLSHLRIWFNILKVTANVFGQPNGMVVIFMMSISSWKVEGGGLSKGYKQDLLASQYKVFLI